MKKIIGEFKEFISRGSVIDLAVGVIIGGAFTAIVNSLVGDIIMPLIGWIFGGVDFSNLSVKLGNDGTLHYGLFVQAVVNFLLVAFAVFMMIKLINAVRSKLERKKEEEEKEEEEEEPSEEVLLLREIRDSLKK